MTSIRQKNKNSAFTIVEAIVAMLVVALCTMSIIEALKMGDDLALRARVDSRGHQEFAKQSKWVAEYPSTLFASIIPPASGPFSESSDASPKILVPQPSRFLMPNQSAFQYKTVLTVTPPSSPGSPYSVSLQTTWQSPLSSSAGGAELTTNAMEIKNFNKW